MTHLYVHEAREMGITDFINQRDDERPVYEVGILCSLSIHLISHKNTSSQYALIFTRKMVNMFFWQRIGEMTGGGVHYSFECAGNLNVLRDAFLSAHEVYILMLLLFWFSVKNVAKILNCNCRHN